MIAKLIKAVVEIFGCPQDLDNPPYVAGEADGKSFTTPAIPYVVFNDGREKVGVDDEVRNAVLNGTARVKAWIEDPEVVQETRELLSADKSKSRSNRKGPCCDDWAPPPGTSQPQNEVEVDYGATEGLPTPP